MLDALKKNQERDKDRVQIVFFFSDGEITSKNEKLGSYADAEEYIVSGAVLGYGTEEGGRMKVLSYEGDYGERFYMKTRGADGYTDYALSKIDEDNLKSIADDLGVEYYHIESPTDMRDIVSNLMDELDEYATSGESGTEGYSETYYWFAIPLAALLVYDLIYYKRRLRE